ncbi:MAG: hypothetical protein U0411_05860 [Thermodesulfovibrionales bacterium]
MRKFLYFFGCLALLCSGAGCLFDPQEEMPAGEHEAPAHSSSAEGEQEKVTVAFIVERPDAISDAELMRMQSSYAGSGMTLDEAKAMIAQHASRKKMPKNMQETIFKALDSLVRHIPVREAYKLVSLRFRLSDLNEFKKTGSSDYERSISLDGRTVFR